MESEHFRLLHIRVCALQGQKKKKEIKASVTVTAMHKKSTNNTRAAKQLKLTTFFSFLLL